MIAIIGASAFRRPRIQLQSIVTASPEAARRAWAALRPPLKNACATARFALIIIPRPFWQLSARGRFFGIDNQLDAGVARFAGRRGIGNNRLRAAEPGDEQPAGRDLVSR